MALKSRTIRVEEEDLREVMAESKERFLKAHPEYRNIKVGIRIMFKKLKEYYNQ